MNNIKTYDEKGVPHDSHCHQTAATPKGASKIGGGTTARLSDLTEKFDEAKFGQT